jgi:GntR family transcriptional regulator
MNKSVANKPLGGPIDFARSSVARYIQLATLFRQRIASGKWREGERLPTVAQLADEFGVARVTLRQALALLAKDGLIQSRRAIGTYVTAPREAPLWCEVQTDWDGLSRATADTAIELLSSEVDVQPARLPEGAVRTAPTNRHYRRLHSRHGMPFLIGDIYLDERVFRLIPKSRFAKFGTPQLLESVPGLEIADAHQVLTITTADVEMAGLLNIPLNAPIARIYRTATDVDGTLIWVGDGFYRGDLVRLDLKLK